MCKIQMVFPITSVCVFALSAIKMGRWADKVYLGMLITMCLYLFLLFHSSSCNNSCRLNRYKLLEHMKMLPTTFTSNFSNTLFSNSPV